MALLTAILFAACGKKVPPPPVQPPPAAAPPPAAPVTIAAPVDARIKTTLTLAASADSNPDANGRPSPVVVRVYQLKNDAAFNGADFFALYDNEQKALGPELVTRDEFLLAPSETRTIDVTLAPDTRFVGTIAAFRDIRNAQWRAVLPAPRMNMHITVARARIALTAGQ